MEIEQMFARLPGLRGEPRERLDISFYLPTHASLCKSVPTRMKRFLPIAGLALCAASVLGAAPHPAPEGKVLLVGIREKPPFSMKTTAGGWEGLDVDLWKGIAQELKLKYEFRELGLDATTDGIRSHSLDLGIGGITMSAERERFLDFSHPYYASGLSIAVRRRTDADHWMTVLRGFYTPAYLRMMLWMVVATFVAGFLVWWFERKRNPQGFGGSTAHGLASAFWWSAVTLTTVGYGDKVPVSFGGRLVGLIWMFTGVVFFAIFTAAMASAVTASRMQSSVRGPEDLVHLRVASVGDSVSETYLRQARIRTKLYPSPGEAMRAVAEGNADAFVYDEPVLKYVASDPALREKVEVLPYVFQREFYGIALPDGSPLRERINPSLLEMISRPSWQETIFRYEGRPSS